MDSFGFLGLFTRFSHFSHFLEIENATIEEPISTLLGVGFVWSPYEEPFIDFWVCLHKILTFLTFLELENGTIEEPISTLLGVAFVWSPHNEPFIDFWVCLHKDLTFCHISSHFPNSKLALLNFQYQHYLG